MNFKDFHVENASPRGRWGQAEKVPYPYYSYYDLLEPKLCKLDGIFPARDPPSHRPPETIKCTSETRFIFFL